MIFDYFQSDATDSVPYYIALIPVLQVSTQSETCWVHPDPSIITVHKVSTQSDKLSYPEHFLIPVPQVSTLSVITFRRPHLFTGSSARA